ncbi:PASTA domain-containing protein [Micromonospora sp. WMMD712]|uniref:PASTA domain-containing protein n=1 Tax=Micromonospora sp. WMMD712 TaxID=3016096 RepID=UPI00249B4536|nr:PASTA domain-containing protein [Micromonospora sp. WMMD712]WFE59399.1 PASTA domain-containing protein [Micromonospora sp. WMMD712]
MSRRTIRRSPALLAALLVLLFGPLAACADEAPTPLAATDAPAAPATTPEAAPTGPTTPGGGPATPTAASAVLPDVTGARLSDAEAQLRAAGFLSVHAVDASGAGRAILEKNNWLVTRQQPAAGAPAALGEAVTLSVARPTDRQPGAEVTSGVVPAVVCRDLQDAQDALREAGFYLLLPKDGLGQGRIPLIDRNWIVVGQSAAPGTRPESSEKIELTVVKFGEPTGNSGCPS